MKRGVVLGAVLGAVAATIAFPVDASARQAGGPLPDSAEAPRIGCLHGAPPPACSTFWVVELQASKGWRLESAPRSDVYEHRFTWYEWNLGHMKNLGDRWAVGGTVSVGNGADDIFTGVRARVRRWINPEMSLEVEAGVAESTGDGAWYPALAAPSVGVRFNIQDYGSAFLRYDGFGAPDGGRFVGPNRPEVPWERQAAVRGGIALGGKAALAGTGVVAAAYVVFLGLYALAGGGT